MSKSYYKSDSLARETNKWIHLIDLEKKIN